MSETTESSEGFASFREFYPFYLGEHQDVNCRRLHFIGTTGIVGLAALALWQGDLRWLLWVPLMGYGFAWLGHFLFEKNKPATFRYPLYSLMGDWVMYRDILLGRISLVR